jgi:DNA-binding CsgD family transcriptional regulator
MDPEFDENNRYTREMLRPFGYFDSIHLFLMKSEGRYAELGLTRHESAGLVTDGDLEVARLLLPHVRRAVTISDLIDMKSLERQALGATLDSIAIGVAIVAGEGRILHTNEAASHMIEAGSPILASNGRLAALHPDVTNELRRAIALAQADEARIGAAGIGVPLVHRDMTAATAHVLPLARGDLRTRLVPQATAAIFIVPAGAPLPVDLGTVARIFGLTPTEARHLEQLIAGTTLAEGAATLGVSLATARTHREHIFEKTGVSRRSDLVALVERLLPPVRRPA